MQQEGTRTPGTVTLIGAGPGDPRLITVAGLEALRAADVVAYDRLVAPALLREVRRDALVLDAGKIPGGQGMHQETINDLLIMHARAGKHVARLKGGDPFVFGRGGEEALALRAQGIPFRVIPGVTSAVAAAACAGIPVTHRGIAGTVLIATGHEAADGPGAALHWESIARAADTLVFLMGMERLETITAALLAAGRPAAQPAALIRWGSTPEQQVLTANLGEIAGAARAAALQPPAALVVGDVVRLREQLAWMEALPLFGARVLVTRARDQASVLAARLAALGALPLELPAIACLPAEDTAALDAALRALHEYGWVVFTSARGVQAVFDRLEAAGRDARAFGGTRLCAVGPATAAALREHGLRPDLVPETFTAAGAGAALAATGIAGARVLLPCADIAPPDLAGGLAQAGAQVHRVTAYRTVAGPAHEEDVRALLAGGVDLVAFTSSSTVMRLLEALGEDRTALAGAAIASIGPRTSETARAAGMTVAAEAAPHTIDGLVAALCRLWEQRRGERP